MIVLRRITWLWQQIKLHRLLTMAMVVILIALIAFALAVSRFGWDWTGFNGGFGQTTTTSTTHGTTTATVQPPGKTLWDWLQLAIIPVVIAVGGIWLNQIQKRREETSTEQRTKTEREIAWDNQLRVILQDYIDKMSELLLHENLRQSKPEDEVRKVARVRTLTILSQIDIHRKRIVIQFLHESGLIDAGKSIIDLSGADLIKAYLVAIDLTNANLSRTNLMGANLLGANLTGANLSEAALFGANLTSADLTGANLINASISLNYYMGANPNNTSLYDANLTNANLTGARLRGADLSSAKFIGADLTSANLTGSLVTKEQWDKAKSLKGATMPDGSIHP